MQAQVSEAERETQSVPEIVAEIIWQASFHDRECQRVKRAIYERVGLADDPRGPRLVGNDDQLDLETLVNTEHVQAIGSLAVALAPVVQRRVEALGDLLPILGNGSVLLDMPAGADREFIANVFRDAGIAERFDWDGWRGAAL